MLVFAGYSACGATHERNDDRAMIGTHVLSGADFPGQIAICSSKTNTPVTACVFDGVGGSIRGDKASLMAATTLAQTSENEDLQARLKACSDSVAEYQKELRKEQRAYTVGAGFQIKGKEGNESITVFHMGDCRVYRFRDGILAQLTKDHSAAQEYRDALGADAEVPAHFAHVVTKFAGGDIAEPFEIGRCVPAFEKDIFMLCSDGLWEYVASEKIEEYLGIILINKDKNDIEAALKQIVQTLADEAKRNGSPDDITIVIAVIS